MNLSLKTLFCLINKWQSEISNQLKGGCASMFGYFLFAVLIVYFFFIWPNFDDLPPRTKRTNRQRIAGRLGLHDKPSVGRIFLTSSQREELLNYVCYTDNLTFSTIAKSKYFYLVEERKSKLSIYCSVYEPMEAVDYQSLQTKNFIRLNIEEKPLKKFLKEVQPLRKVE